MPKSAGTYPMTPIEDHIARALSLSGRSCREIADLLGRSDKTISLAIFRASEDDEHPLLALAAKKGLLDHLSAADNRLLKNVRDFARWLKDGEENGYVAALVGLLAESD